MLPTLMVLIAAAQVADAAAPSTPSPAVAAAAPVSALPTDVDIAIASVTPEAAAAVREDLVDLLTRRGLAARYRRLPSVDRDEVLRPASEAPCALACIWIDLGVAKAARAFVYVSATASEQVVIRSLPLPGGFDEVAREEVAHIVATSVEALQAGRPLPAATGDADAALAKATRPAPPPPAPAPRRVWLAGLGGGAAHEGASQLALPVASLSLVVGAERSLAPALWLALGAFASDASGDPVALRFHGGELAVLGAIGTRATDAGAPRRVVARLGLGPGVELREASPTAASGASGVTVDADRLDASLLVRAAARLEVRLFDSLGLFVAAACDARVVSHRYLIAHDDGMSQALYQPDLLRPSVIVGIDARLSAEGAP